MFLPIPRHSTCGSYCGTVLSDYTAVLIIRYSFQMYLPVTEPTYIAPVSSEIAWDPRYLVPRTM